MFKSTEHIYQLSRRISTFSELVETVKQENLPLKVSGKKHYEAIVILSHQVNDAGELSDLTKNRVMKGCKLFSERFADYLVMAGRDMHTGKDLPLARIMWEYAFEQGIEEYDKDGKRNIDINIEPKGTDTIMQLFCFVRDHMMRKGRKEFILATDDYQGFGKAIAYCAFICGDDFQVGYAMSDTLKIFGDYKKQRAALEKQFSSLDMSEKMFRGICPGIKHHKEIMERIFSEHDRYKGQNPGDYFVNIP